MEVPWQAAPEGSHLILASLTNRKYALKKYTHKKDWSTNQHQKIRDQKISFTSKSGLETQTEEFGVILVIGNWAVSEDITIPHCMRNGDDFS